MGIGVDIGSRAIRVVETKGFDGGDIVVRKAAALPLPRGAVANGVIVDMTVVGNVLREVLEAAKVGRRGLVLGINQRASHVAQLRIPHDVAPHEWEGWLRRQNPRLSPRVALDSSALAFRSVSIVPTHAGQREHLISLAAVETHAIEVLNRLAAQLKLTLRAIDLNAAADVRALCRNNGAPLQVEAVVNIGGTTNTFTVRDGDHLRAVNVNVNGGDGVTSAVAQAAEAPRADAETLKQNVDVAPFGSEARVAASWSELTDAAEPRRPVEKAVVDDNLALCKVVRASLEADRREHPHKQVSAVLLAGAACLQPGLPDLLARSLGVPTRSGAPKATFAPEAAPELRAGRGDAELLYDFTTAIGLSMGHSEMHNREAGQAAVLPIGFDFTGGPRRRRRT